MPGIADTSLVRADDRAATLRLAALGSLLVGELFVLGTRFEAAPLKRSGSAFLTLLGEEGVIPLAAAIGTAAVLFGSAGLRAELRTVALEFRRRRRWWPFLLGHLLAFALFVPLTGEVLAGADHLSAAEAVWLLAWTAAGAVAVGLWGAALLPGRALVALARPLVALASGALFVGVVAWAAGFVTRSWWHPLGYLTAQVVGTMLTVLFDDPVLRIRELTLGTRHFVVQVAPSCSGYQGIGLIWVFLGTYLWLSRRTLRFPHALLLLPLGTVVVWVANTLRIAALVAVGTWISPAIAMGGFHSSAGVLLFCAIALGMLWVTERSRFFALAASTPATATPANATAAYLMPLLAIVATSTATTALSAGGLDLLYPLRVVAAVGALWYFRAHYRDLRWTWSWTAAAAGALTFVVWMALEPSPAAGSERGLEPALAALPAGWATLWLVFRVLGTVVTVPIAEELAFRGYLGRRLASASFEQVPLGRFAWLPFLGSSIAFGLMHDRLISATLAGMIYALVLYRRGQLGDAVVAHATTNALLAGFVLLTGSWSLWG
jgi:exosortase E/protease (VPEID-CTERM system)